MLLAGVDVPNNALAECLDRSAAELLGGTDPLYSHLLDETARASNEVSGRRRALSVAMMPVGYFGIRAAVEAAEHPDISPALPQDVWRRGQVLQGCAYFMITNAVRQGVFTRSYHNHDELRPVLRAHHGDAAIYLSGKLPQAVNELGNLGEVAIMDESLVAGGVLRFLQQKHREKLQQESAAAIMGRSVGLQLTARVPDDSLEAMRIYLGPRYVQPKHLRLNYDTVDFTPQTREYLHGLLLPAKGCPARSILTGGHSEYPTYLQLVWSDLAGVLLPPNAKAEQPPLRPAGKKRGKR